MAVDITRLLISCPDQPGIVAAVSQFLAESGANIVHSDQHSTDPEGGEFFMRMEFNLPLTDAERSAFEQGFQETVAEQFGMRWWMRRAQDRLRLALFVSRYDHCLLDLLWRARRGELELDVGLVISNHPDLAEDVRAFGVPYVHIPVTRECKPEAERRQIELLAGNVDLIVLARYMQILSGDFLKAVGAPVINIHHSFLPAFAGASPHQRARDRGVKLIGATAHYATEELDEGPIIEQDVIRVTHRMSSEELERRGADVERTVLARAVQWHCEDRVLRHGAYTVVF